MLTKLKENLYAFFLYCLVAIVMTFPLALFWSDRISSIGDSLAKLSSTTFIEDKIRAFDFNFKSDYLWHPYAIDIKLMTDGLIYYSLFFFIKYFSNQFFAHNFIVLLFLAFNGFSLYYVLRVYFKHSFFGAFIGGFVYGFSSYFLARISQITLLSGFVFPFLLLACLRYHDKKSLINLINILLVILLASLSSYVYFFYTLIFIFLFSLIFRNLSLTLLSVYVYLTVLMFAFFFDFASFSDGNRVFVPTFSAGEQDALGATLIDFLVPSENSLVGKFFARLLTPYYKSYLESVFVGILELGILIFYIFAKPLRNKKTITLDAVYGKILLIGVAFLILSLGPLLHIKVSEGYTARDKIVLPYYLIMHIPLFSYVRYAHRLSIVFMMTLGIIVSLFLSRHKFNKLLICGLISIFFLERFIYPSHLYQIPIPQLFREWSFNGGDFTVMNIPLGPVISAVAQYDQTYHKKKLIGGLINGRNFKTGKFIKFFFSERVRPYFSCQSIIENYRVTDEEFRNFLKEHKTKYIIVYKKDLEKKDCVEHKMQEAINETIMGRYEKIYEDEYRQIFTVKW